MELWDAYDASLNKIDGLTLVRGTPIKDGIYHLVCDIIVRHTDGTYLLMQRDSNKRHGGLWEASAGGSCLKGETALEGAMRELFEETGIRTDNLTELGYVVNHPRHAISYKFLCVTDCPKDSIVLQQGETQNYCWVTKEALFSLPPTELVTTMMLGLLH